MSRNATATWPTVTVADGRLTLGYVHDHPKGITATDADGVAIGTKFPNRAEAQAAIIEYARALKATTP